MSGKINLDLKSLKFIFERNKPYLFPILIMLVCIILFVQFVIPQFRDLLTAQKEGKEASVRLRTLKESLKVLTNTNEDSLDFQLKVLNLALPLSKDFSGILNAIYFASQKAGIGLGSFSLQIGNLSETKEKDNFPTINLTVPVNSDAQGVNSFVETINKTIPLSEVFLIKTGDRVSFVSLHFYYKPLSASNYREDSRIIPVSQKGLLLINRLSGFENMSSGPVQLPAATSSSELNL